LFLKDKKRSSALGSQDCYLFKKIGAFTSVQAEALSTDQFAAFSTSQIAALWSKS